MISTLAIVFVAATSGAWQDGVVFDGVWSKNPEESDDARQRMQAATSQMGAPGGRGGGMPRGGRRGEGPPRGERGGPGGQGPAMAAGADVLTIVQGSGELRVDDGERLTIFYLDGEEHRRETPNGDRIETVAELRGEKVIVEEKMERGESTREFELSPDGRVLVVTTTLKMERMSETVVIRSVYEREDAGGSKN